MKINMEYSLSQDQEDELLEIYIAVEKKMPRLKPAYRKSLFWLVVSNGWVPSVIEGDIAASDRDGDSSRKLRERPHPQG